MCGNICGKEKCCSGVFLQPDVDISIKKKKIASFPEGAFYARFKNWNKIYYNFICSK